MTRAPLSPPAAPVAPVRGVRAVAVLTAVALSGFIAMLDNTVVHVALPSMQRELSLSAEELEWVAVSYVLVFSTLMLLGGRLSDLVGRRAVLVAGLCVFTAASVCAGLAESGASLIAARGVQGAGAACVIPASLAVVAGDLPERSRTFAVGVWTAALAVALASGPVLGGAVTEHGGWEWVFLLNLPFGVVAALLALAVPRRCVGVRRSPSALLRVLDMPGVLLSGVALFLLTYALVEGGERGFGRSPVPECLLGAGVAGAAFLFAQSRAFTPLVDPRAFRSRSLTGGAAAQVLWGVGVNGVFFFTSLYLQRILGFSPTDAGLVFLPLALTLLAVTPAAEPLARVFGAHRVIAAGLAMVGGGLLCVAGQGASAGYADLQPGLLLIGAGSAFTAPMTVAALADVPAARAGTASGLVSTAREVSGVFGVVLVGVVLTRHEHSALRAGLAPDAAFLDGYHAGLRVGAGAVLCGACVVVVTLRRRGRHRGRVHR
ncbi:MFS transporter [Streptomyces sp. ODS28]|uniref:MFS transporter n=1 Tax=Streptomyces sp. ODS28 TaxID=3136688 RepID=UPI0031E58A37